MKKFKTSSLNPKEFTCSFLKAQRMTFMPHSSVCQTVLIQDNLGNYSTETLAFYQRHK